MADDNTELSITENPDGFVSYPTDHVYGFVDEPVINVPLIYGDLLSQDIATDAIFVYRGQAGIEALSPSGKDYGIKGRIQRFIQSLGYESKHLSKVEDELCDGHAFIGVSVEDEDTKTSVARILHAHGGHDVKYYGRATIVDL